MDMKDRNFGDPWWWRCRRDHVDSNSHLQSTGYTSLSVISSENRPCLSSLFDSSLEHNNAPSPHWTVGSHWGIFLTLPKCACWKDSDLQWPRSQSFQEILSDFWQESIRGQGESPSWSSRLLSPPRRWNDPVSLQLKSGLETLTQPIINFHHGEFFLNKHLDLWVLMNISH